ncbi:hypothetical protein BVRB_2g027510 [Beta vulgaris subsp. vulgaris]|uniref:pre-mRNA-splicing factor slt11 isoform X2 n=1 Tax=Beta vulgaris subsp. vulgaris TaxID=3555 RepID=UPI00065C635E|nr:pre-mRNA-splicing factor slt11 isoform X2 [Beta vulgaris subsp. vulgaris]KMT18621.1 hypothetical protein BVRB_2g027510 [Beta vulgaris subsp. vulgaris]
MGQSQSQGPLMEVQKELEVCESCSIKDPQFNKYDKGGIEECEICTRPFVYLFWHVEGFPPYKGTRICRSCSKLRKVCQCCLVQFHDPEAKPVFHSFCTSK